MDDNQNNDKIQRPVFMKPEEVGDGVENPEEISGSFPADMPENIPIYEHSTNKGIYIIGIVIFFMAVFGGVYWFFLKDMLAAGDNPTSVPVSSSAEPVTLTYWGLWEDVDIFQPVIDKYEKENSNITIEYERMSPEQYLARLVARSKAGNGPDIFRFHNTWLPQIKEIIAPIPEDIYTKDEFEKSFYPIHKKDLSIGEQKFGIPLSIDGLVLIYNKRLLGQAGISEAPTTWVGSENDVFSAVEKLTVKDPTGSIVTSGIAAGTATNVDHFGEIFSVLLLLNGGDFTKLSEPEAVEALELYRKFSEDGFWSEDMSNSTTSFIQEKVAMILAPSWQIINIKLQNPNLEIGVAKIPKGIDDAEVSLASYWVEGVNVFSKSQAESWKFLKYLSEKEQLQLMHEEQSKIRLFGSAFPRRDMAKLLSDHPYLSPVISQAENDIYVSLPVADFTHDEGMNDEILQYLENAISATVNGTDYAAALSTAQQGVTTVMGRYKIE